MEKRNLFGAFSIQCSGELFLDSLFPGLTSWERFLCEAALDGEFGREWNCIRRLTKVQKQRIASLTFLGSLDCCCCFVVPCCVFNHFVVLYFRDFVKFSLFIRGLLLLPSFNFFFLHDFGEFASTGRYEWSMEPVIRSELLLINPLDTVSLSLNSEFSMHSRGVQQLRSSRGFSFTFLRTDNHFAANILRDLHVSSRWRINFNWVSLKTQAKKMHAKSELTKCFTFQIVSALKPHKLERFWAGRFELRWDLLDKWWI